MALERNVTKFTAGDIGPAGFVRRKARVQTVDAAGEPTGNEPRAVTTLSLGFVVEVAADPKDEDEVFLFDVGVVPPAVLQAAWQAFTPAQRTAILDEAWADFKAKNKLTEV